MLHLLIRTLIYISCYLAPALLADFIFESLLWSSVVGCLTVVITFALIHAFGDKTHKVNTFINVWLSVTMLFASLYGAWYFKFPKSFALKEEWFDKSYLNKIDAIQANLYRSYREYTLASFLDENAGILSREVRKGEHKAYINKSPYFATWDTILFPHQTTLILSNTTIADATGPITGSFSLPTSTYAVELFLGGISERYVLTGDEVSPIVNSRDPKVIREAARKLMRDLDKVINSQLNQANVLASNARKLNFIDFVYLSFSISTTIGSTGIEADSKSMKVLFTFQSFMVVIYLGMLLEIINTERKAQDV